MTSVFDQKAYITMYVVYVRSTYNTSKTRTVCYGSRVPARRKGGTSGMLRSDSAGIRPEQKSGPGIRPSTNRNENQNVPPSHRPSLSSGVPREKNQLHEHVLECNYHCDNELNRPAPSR
jgi:hypothetical protein